jgi:hypothetical protein
MNSAPNHRYSLQAPTRKPWQTEIRLPSLKELELGPSNFDKTLHSANQSERQRQPYSVPCASGLPPPPTYTTQSAPFLERSHQPDSIPVAHPENVHQAVYVQQQHPPQHQVLQYSQYPPQVPFHDSFYQLRPPLSPTISLRQSDYHHYHQPQQQWQAPPFFGNPTTTSNQLSYHFIAEPSNATSVQKGVGSEVRLVDSSDLQLMDYCNEQDGNRMSVLQLTMANLFDSFFSHAGKQFTSAALSR